MGETLAAKLLQKKGHQILALNLRSKLGEIDILSKEGRTIVVTEVKTKTSDFFGAAIEMITPVKQRKLVLLTHHLQAQYKTNNVRIDVVAVDNAGSEPRLTHHKGVIEYHG
ncbi:MAG: YraN family protein [Candidatus Berkelbacteria bacterium]|nr:MAG: YraN family protein [Candidatus Berkelbacteria bacterium]